MKKWFLVAALLAAGSVQAQRSPEEGKRLAQAAVLQLKQLEPLVLEGRGLAGAPSATYFRTFLNPLEDSVRKWPVLGDKENSTWGDYLYCRDALLGLQTIGMGQENSTLSGDNLKRRIADYKLVKGKCQAASRLSPEQVQ